MKITVIGCGRWGSFIACIWIERVMMSLYMI